MTDSSEDVRKRLKVAGDQARAIEALITSDASPVGIDAKQTHVLILNKLLDIERRLESLEQRLSER